MIANCDIVLASPSAVFALPEVKRGVVAIAGALPRLARAIGRMRAMEMALRYALFEADSSLFVMNLRSKSNAYSQNLSCDSLSCLEQAMLTPSRKWEEC